MKTYYLARNEREAMYLASKGCCIRNQFTLPNGCLMTEFAIEPLLWECVDAYSLKHRKNFDII